VPELPETETIARDLDRAVSGAAVTGVRVHRPDVLREVDSRKLGRRLRGATIVRSLRRAKHVVIEFDTADRVVVQPRFTGMLLVDDGQLEPSELEYIAVTLELDDGRRLHYRDVRRLGTVTLMGADRFEAYFAALGEEPLEAGFTALRLWEVLQGSRRAVKAVLMDQKAVVGVGNIYANEALWRSGIDPSRRSDRVTREEAALLRDETVGVLREAIEARGTSFRDYRDASGEEGAFASILAVYGRGGEPCRRCGRRLVETHAVDGRQTVFCAECQR
jgi:formamidopyrimidine-DNA glycosylase